MAFGTARPIRTGDSGSGITIGHWPTRVAKKRLKRQRRPQVPRPSTTSSPSIGRLGVLNDDDLTSLDGSVVSSLGGGSFAPPRPGGFFEPSGGLEPLASLASLGGSQSQ
jgi:hypothetical protein